jgi:hypothetical protein
MRKGLKKLGPLRTGPVERDCAFHRTFKKQAVA